MHEALPVPFAVGPEMRGGQGHRMVDLGHMFGRHADLDHLDPFARFQHPMADLRRLDEAVAGMQCRRIPP
jgi:hypothetical protein